MPQAVFGGPEVNAHIPLWEHPDANIFNYVTQEKSDMGGGQGGSK